MQCEVVCEGAYAAARILLSPGEQVNTEPGAMLAMSKTLKLEGKVFGGGIGTMVSKFLTGSSVRTQTIKAGNTAGELYLAPAMPGDICVKELNAGEEIYLNHGCYLASSPTVKYSIKILQPLKALLGGNDFAMQSLTGPGTVVFSSFGSIIHRRIAPGLDYVVDNEHLIAWSASLKYSVEKSSSGIFSSYLSEGLVYTLQGPGDVYFQTRGPGALAKYLEETTKK
ncbi:TIGR00266 family protein [bacterium]|nr:TIGR00266 family protein [bacterium]